MRVRACVCVCVSFLELSELPKSQTVCVLARKVDTNNVSAAIVHVTVHFAVPISVQTIISDDATFLVSCLTIVIMC